MIKKKFTIGGMHCTSCAMNIDGELEDTPGVKEANTSYVKQRTEVLYDENLIDEEKFLFSGPPSHPHIKSRFDNLPGYRQNISSRDNCTFFIDPRVREDDRGNICIDPRSSRG